MIAFENPGITCASSPVLTTNVFGPGCWLPSAAVVQVESNTELSSQSTAVYCTTTESPSSTTSPELFFNTSTVISSFTGGSALGTVMPGRPSGASTTAGNPS